MGLLSTLTNRNWEAPQFVMPMPVPASALKELGIDGGGRHFFASKYGECIEGLVVDASTRELPNTLLVEVGPNQFRTFGSFAAPGTFERLQSAAPRVPKPPMPHRPVDVLAHLFLITRRPERHDRFGIVAEAEADARGAPGILGRLARKGATVRLSTDRAALVVTTSGGHLGPGVLELVDRAGPLLLAHLRGESLACTVSKHKTPAHAVSVALGGAPWCGECGGAS